MSSVVAMISHVCFERTISTVFSLVENDHKLQKLDLDKNKHKNLSVNHSITYNLSGDKKLILLQKNLFGRLFPFGFFFLGELGK